MAGGGKVSVVACSGDVRLTKPHMVHSGRVFGGGFGPLGRLAVPAAAADVSRPGEIQFERLDGGAWGASGGLGCGPVRRA